MKKVLKVFGVLGVLLCWSCMCMAQEGTHFEELSYQEALLKAKQLNKKVFVDCYTQSCGPCKMMARRIFPQKVCGDYFNPRYVCIMKDMQKGDGLEIAKKYNVRVYPTFLVLDTDGSLILRYEAGASRDASQFVQQFSEQFDLSAKKLQFEKGGYDDAFLLDFMNLLERHDPLFLQKVMETVMTQWDAERLSCPASWDLMKRVLRNPENQLFRKVLDIRNELVNRLGEEEVINFILSVYHNEFRTMKAMDLNWQLRMNDLDAFVEKYDGARLLKCRMTCYQIVHQQQTERVDELLKVVKRLKKEFSQEEERASVLKEMMGIQRFVKDPKQRKEFYVALKKLRPSFDKHAGIVDELMSLLK